jgi:hypothetical protein
MLFIKKDGLYWQLYQQKMGEVMENLDAVFSDESDIADEFEMLQLAIETEYSHIYFPEDGAIRLSVESLVYEDSAVNNYEFAERVAACINSCLGVPTDLVEQNTLSDLLAIRHQRDELLALAVRAEFELATCADRGAGDVDHGLLPDLRAMIAKIKGDGHG